MLQLLNVQSEPNYHARYITETRFKKLREPQLRQSQHFAGERPS